MHSLTIFGIILIAVGTYFTYLGQEINSKKALNLLSNQNTDLQKSNAQLSIDVKAVKKINEELERRIKPLSGILIPSDKSTINLLDVPVGAFALFFGNSVAYTNEFPHTIIQVGNDPLLVINKLDDRLTISAKFFSRDGKIIAELRDNKFDINPNNYFHIERPNEHILIVYDQEAKQILNIEYLNPSAMKLLGKFYLPNRPPIIIDEEWQNFGGIKLSKTELGYNKVDIHLQ